VNPAPSEIRCMLIPLRAGRLLLPSATVAEVIGYREPAPVLHGAPWLRGKVNWQQREIPVVDFERLLGRADTTAGIRQRIVVCYAPNAVGGWPLLGLLAQGIPRLLRVSSEAIESVRHGDAAEAAVRMTLSIGGDEALLPDLDYLQAQLPAH